MYDHLALRHLLLAALRRRAAGAAGPDRDRLEAVAATLEVGAKRARRFPVTWRVDGAERAEEFAAEALRFYRRGDRARDQDQWPQRGPAGPANLAFAERWVDGLLAAPVPPDPPAVAARPHVAARPRLAYLAAGLPVVAAAVSHPPAAVAVAWAAALVAAAASERGGAAGAALPVAGFAAAAAGRPGGVLGAVAAQLLLHGAGLFGRRGPAAGRWLGAQLGFFAGWVAGPALAGAPGGGRVAILVAAGPVFAAYFVLGRHRWVTPVFAAPALALALVAGGGGRALEGLFSGVLLAMTARAAAVYRARRAGWLSLAGTGAAVYAAVAS